MRDDRLRRYFKALGDKTRFDIVEELGRIGEGSVSALCLELGVTQPLMSWHVRVLRNAGIVSTRRRGRQVFCSLDRKTIVTLQERFMLLVQGQPLAADAPLPSPVRAAVSPPAAARRAAKLTQADG